MSDNVSDMIHSVKETWNHQGQDHHPLRSRQTFNLQEFKSPPVDAVTRAGRNWPDHFIQHELRGSTLEESSCDRRTGPGG